MQSLLLSGTFLTSTGSNPGQPGGGNAAGVGADTLPPEAGNTVTGDVSGEAGLDGFDGLVQIVTAAARPKPALDVRPQIAAQRNAQNPAGQNPAGQSNNAQAQAAGEFGAAMTELASGQAQSDTDNIAALEGTLPNLLATGTVARPDQQAASWDPTQLGSLSPNGANAQTSVIQNVTASPVAGAQAIQGADPIISATNSAQANPAPVISGSASQPQPAASVSGEMAAKPQPPDTPAAMGETPVAAKPETKPDGQAKTSMTPFGPAALASNPGNVMNPGGDRGDLTMAGLEMSGLRIAGSETSGPASSGENGASTNPKSTILTQPAVAASTPAPDNAVNTAVQSSAQPATQNAAMDAPVTPAQTTSAPAAQTPAASIAPAQTVTQPQAPIQPATGLPAEPVQPLVTADASAQSPVSAASAPSAASMTADTAAPANSANNATGAATSAVSDDASTFAGLTKAEPAAVAKAQKASPAANQAAASAASAQQAQQPALQPAAEPAPASASETVQTAASMGQTPGAQLAQRIERNASAGATNNANAKQASSVTAPAQSPTNPSPANPVMTGAEMRPAEAVQLQQAPLGGLPLNAEAPPPPPVMAESAQAFDAELSLTRTGAQPGAERSPADLPRFAAHTAQHLAVQISRRFQNGNHVFQIRLDPADLGRVDVKLEMTGDNRVQAHLSVERADTLIDLQRAAKDLERALNEAGLELEENGLSFELSEDAGQSGFDEDDENALPVYETGDYLDFDDDAAASAEPREAYGFRLAGARDRVDMLI